MSMSKMKSIKHNKNAHTSNSKFGMGDYYGQGVKQNQARIIDDSMNYSAVSPKKLKKPPKALA